jgi:hypothetical protein
MPRSSISQLLIAALLSAASGSAVAQTYGVGVSGSTPNLGEVASGASGLTYFDVAPSTGAITKSSGSGARVSTGTSRATVTISCGNTNACNTTDVNIRIGSGAWTGRARQLSGFSVSMGTATLKSGPTGTDPISFRIGPVGKSSSKTFYLGMDVPIAGDDSGSATGAASSSFYVWADDYPNTPTGSQSGSGTVVATVFRSLSLTKNSDLAFGRIVKPVSGLGGTVSLAASNAAKSFPSGVAWLNLPVATRASYTVTGEGGQTLAVSIPSTFVMNGPSASTLTVTTNNNLAATPTLSSIIGNSGTYSFFVGGSFPISPSTQSGAYTGVFAVTVAYN